MRSPTKNTIAYYAALTLLFGVIENLLPHFLPFLRLGLSNIPILIALLDFSPLAFCYLVVLKWFTNAFVSGLLFSPFALFSLLSSTASALVMYILYTLLKDKLTLYSYSLFGALSSNIVQLFLASIYLRLPLTTLLPYILLFSAFSAAITAYIATRLKLISRVPELEEEERESKRSYYFIFPLLSLLITPFEGRLLTLLLVFILALLMQLFTSRRIRIMPYLMLFTLTTALSLFNKDGKVLLGFITEGALKQGLTKALTLMCLVALSQTLVGMLDIKKGILAKTLLYASALSYSLKLSKGKLIDRINQSVRLEEVKPKEIANKGYNKVAICIISSLILLIEIIF